jgi:hypothetical protein
MKRTVLLSISALLVTLFLSVTANAGLPGSGGEPNRAVSPALQIIAHYTPMAKAGLLGHEILFTADDFERALNLSRLSTITITQVPDVTEGELFVGSVKLSAGQTVSRGNLSQLSFAASNEKVSRASFSFAVNNSAYSIDCNLYLLSKINRSPSAVSRGPLEVSTYRDIAVYGRLHAIDPEGDKLTYQIVTYPKNGALIFTDDNGSYVYFPNAGFTGRDRLTYVVYDTYGNYSAAASVTLRVEKNSTSLAYDDMKWHRAYSAAIKLGGEGIMSGTQIGDGYYFYPDQTVSRAEFLVMAMKAAGVSRLPDVEDTGFYDDDDIAGSMKSYVGAAARAGYIKGSYVEGKICFLPDKDITVSEAAVMLANIMGLGSDGSVAVFAKNSGIPAWAEDAVWALCSAGVLVYEDYDYNATVTRGDAAVMLDAMMRLLD